MKEIVIIGTGGLAAEITTFIDNNSEGQYRDLSIKGYIEYDYNIDKYWKRYSFEKPVIGDIDSYEITGEEYFVVGIANVKFRNFVINKVKEKGGRFINLIHPTAIVNQKSVIGTGNIISPYSIIGPNVRMGDFNVLTEQSIISHDCNVGNNNVFSTCILCGHITVKDDNFFGIRSTVIPRLKIGSRNMIQAGMIVDKDIPDDAVIFHRFKEKVLAMPRDKDFGCDV